MVIVRHKDRNVCDMADKETARGTNFMFIRVFTIATLYYMLSTLFYVNFSFYGLNSNKGYKSVRKPSHLPISRPTKWSRQATLQKLRPNQKMHLMRRPLKICVHPPHHHRERISSYPQRRLHTDGRLHCSRGLSTVPDMANRL